MSRWLSPRAALAALDALSAGRLALLAGLAGAAALAGALASQHLGGLRPCALCYGQRYPYWIALGLGLAAPLLPAAGARALLALVGGLLAGNASLALYHVGVEQKWWESFLAACTGGGGAGRAQSVDALLAQLQATPIVRCDAVPISVLGLSMAGWNAVYAAALAALVLAWLIRSRRTTP